MNIMKIFVLGRRESDAFARQHGCELDDFGTLSVLDALRQRLCMADGCAQSDNQALLSFVTLLTAQRYNVQADRMLKTCREDEFVAAHGLERLPELIDALIGTLSFYDHVDMIGRLPESDDASVQELTNQLFAIIAVHFPLHLARMAEDWARPEVLPWLQSLARDPEGYEPVFSPTHRQFMEAVDRTYCIFAPSGKYWGADEWHASESFAQNVDRFARGLFRFMTVARKEKFKGFAVRLPAQMSVSVEELARTTALLLAAMNRIDPVGSHCLDGDVGAPGWKFEWAGEPMFLTAFGTCYPEDHPRNPYGFGHTYFFFQPDFVLRAHPALVDGKEEVSRARIMANFSKHGMSYDNENKSAEGERYIRPLDPEGPPVQWWRYLPRKRAGAAMSTEDEAALAET